MKTSGYALFGTASLVVAICFSGVEAASAQTEVEPPKPYERSDERYVDLASLALNVSSPTISIGSAGQGGLSYSATYVPGPDTWRHSTFGGIYRRSLPFKDAQYQPYQWYEVSVPGASAYFRDNGFGTLELVPGSGSGTLVPSGNSFIYTARDGTVYSFAGSINLYSPYRTNKGLLTTISRPSGEVITYTYTGGNPYRIQTISNNLGYQIHFDYTGTGQSPSKVTLFNAGVDTCAYTAATCAFSQTWPSLTFTSNGNVRSVADALGRTLRLIKDSSGSVVGVARPTTPSGQNLTYTFASGPQTGTYVTSVSDGVGTWTYSRTVPINPSADYYTGSTTVTNPLSQATLYDFEWIDPFADGAIQSNRVNRLVAVTDPLNQQRAVMQDAIGVHSMVDLEGNRTNYSYNNGNLAGSTRIAKSGSGLASTSITAVFGDCSTAIRCGRPTSVTDARGAVTNYTYDAAGNVLNETSPAPTPGAPRPQTRYTWEQRYAWYRQNGSSSITQAPSPVWVQTGSSSCMTGATCQ